MNAPKLEQRLEFQYKNTLATEQKIFDELKGKIVCLSIAGGDYATLGRSGVNFIELKDKCRIGNFSQGDHIEDSKFKGIVYETQEIVNKSYIRSLKSVTDQEIIDAYTKYVAMQKK